MDWYNSHILEKCSLYIPSLSRQRQDEVTHTFRDCLLSTTEIMGGQ